MPTIEIPKYQGLDFMQTKADAELIISLLNKDDIMLEYGMGASTLFYSQFVKEYHSIESEKEWYDRVMAKVPKNVKGYLIPQTMKYEEFPTQKEIDIVKEKFNFSTTKMKISKPYFAGEIEDWPVIQYLRFEDYVKKGIYIGTDGKVFNKIFIDSRAKVFCSIIMKDCLSSDSIVIVHDFYTRPEYESILNYYDVVDGNKPPIGDMVALKIKSNEISNIHSH